MPSSVARRIVQRAHLILDNRNNASYIADIEVEVVISYTTPLGVTWQWTRKVDGKTVTRRLSPAEATLYEEWITNGRRLEELVREMRNLSREAGEILLRDVRDT